MRRYINLLVVTLVLISLFVASIFPPQTASASPLLAVTISPTKTDAIINDGVPLSEAADGKADPGETIEYTVVIPNNGDTAATGVTFNDIIDLNTTLVGGSLNVSPLAVDDNYDTIGNTLLEVGVTASGNPAVRVTNALIDSLFDNDIEFLSDTFTLKSVEAVSGAAPLTAATESGGSVTVQADGTFSYTPPVGFSGADHFDYVLTDDGPDNILGNADDLTGAGRVTINVNTQQVWYVKNNAPPGGDGRSTQPFDTLAEAQTASSAGHTIYVYNGNGTTTGQNLGIVLKNGQRLVGEGVALTMPVSVNGGANPTSLRGAGSQPQIDNTVAGSNGVSVTNLNNIEIRGLNIAGNTNAIDVTTNGANSGSFEIANNTIRAAGAEGIDVNGGGSGTLTASLHDNTVTATGNGIDIQRIAGSVNITAFDDNTVSGNTGGIGINIVGTGGSILFDTNPVTGTYDVVSGGATAIGQAGNGVGTSGLVMNNIRGDLSFTDLDIYSDNGVAFFVNGTSPNYTGTTGTRVTVNTGTPTLVAVGGAALDVTDANINIIPTTFSSSITTAIRGVSLLRVSGTLTAPSGSTLTSTSATGMAFFVDGGSNANANVNVTYPGTITADIGRLVQIQNVNPTVAASYAFSGAITDNNDSDGNEQGILLDNNDNGTITFSGGLAVRTTSNAAFTATNGGTVNVCDENPCNSGATGALVNTLTSTTATALNINATTIGANNLEFKSISSSGGTATGIILVNTGSAGALVVKGDGGTTRGGNGSGGTITNKTGGTDGDGTGASGVYINSGSATLRNMNLTRFDNFGVYGLSVNNVTVQYSTVGAISGSACADADGDIGTSTGAQDAAIVFGKSNPSGLNGFNTTGNPTFLLDNLKVFCSIEHQIEIYQQSNSFTGTVSNSDIKDNSTSGGSDGILTEMQGTANGTIVVDTVSFDDNKSQAVQGAANDSSVLDMTITNSTVVRSTQGNEGLILSNGSNGDLAAHITNNNISGIGGVSIFVGQTAGNATASSSLVAYIKGNTIVAPASATNHALIAYLTSTVGQISNANILVENNIITQNSTSGVARPILIDTPDANTTPSFTATVLNNTVSVDSTFGLTADVTARRGTGCFDVRNNMVSGPFGIRVRQANAGTTVQLEQGVSGSAVPATVLDDNHPAGTLTSVLGTITVVGNSTCQTPPVAMSPTNNGTLAQNQPEPNPVVLAQAADTNLNSANTFAVASASVKPSEQASEIAPTNTVANTSVNVGGGKPIFRIKQPIPAQSETVTVPAFTLPAGKSVTIKFQVTVNDPVTLGTTQISNQGTISGSNFSNIQTDDPSVGGGSDPTITPVDRPDANVNSINRQTPSGANTNATSVTWRVTFANAISGLASSNFNLTQSGLSGATITGVSAVTGSPDTQWDVTANGYTGDGTLGLDFANDTSLSHDVPAFTAGQDYTVDTTPPTITNVTSTSNSGCLGSSPYFCNASDVVHIQVTFSEMVNVTGTPQLALNSGSTASYASGSGTSTLTFDYTVVSGENASDLDYTSTSALTLNGGTIRDAATNNTTLTLAAPGASGSLGFNANVVIDTVAPTTSYFHRLNPLTSPTNSDTLQFEVDFSERLGGSGSFGTSDFELIGTPGTTAIISGVGSLNVSNGTFSVDVSGGDLASYNGTVGISYGASMFITDQAGNPVANADPSDNETYTVDNMGPTVTINQAAGQVDPTGTSPINFTIVFSESVGTSFVTGDVNLSASTAPGTLTGTVTEIAPNDGTTYNVAVTGMTGNGLVIASVNAGVATDGVNTNAVSTSTDNTVTYDATQPTVTINQAAGQSDPTGTSPINFTVVFSESVGASFATGDVNLSASTVPGTLTGTVTEIAPNNGTTYNVAVSGMTGDGTVIASINAGVATDGINTNAASTSTDNSVLYDTLNPNVTINQAVSQADPTGTNPIAFTVVFSEPVTDFNDLTDVTLAGTASATVTSITEVAPMNGTTYTVAVTATSQGTVIASIPSAVAQDLGGRDNTASTSTDNTVTYDATAPNVTINQASGQADPTGTSPINFTVVFSEAVTDFDDAADVTLSGTAGATTVTITEVTPNNGTTYNVTITGMTQGGAVIASINANVATDLAGNNNAASTSTDNTVTFTVNTTTTITSDNPDPSTVGQAVTVNFTVIATVGPNPSTGNVTVTDSSGATPCVGAVTAGAGSCNITLTTSGSHTLTATYAATGTYNGSNDTESHSVSVTIAVNTFTDELNSNGNCSLREAVRAANTNTAVDTCPAGSASTVDVITLATGTYNLTVGGTDNAAVSGDLDITRDTRITGAGAASTIISGLNLPSPGDRIFHILSGTVQIENLTIKKGKNAIGAGIYNAGTLTLNSVTVTDSIATTGASGTSSGAGIYSTGTLTLNNSTVSNNLATSGYKGSSLGAGIHNNSGTVTLNSSTVTGNRAISGIQGTSQGGGIYTAGGGTTILNSTTPSGNTVTTGSGGIAQGPNTYP